MADQSLFVVLPLATVMGERFADAAAAEAAAGKKVDAEGRPHVVVQIVGEVRRRLVPNVEVVRFCVPEAVANG